MLTILFNQPVGVVPPTPQPSLGGGGGAKTSVSFKPLLQRIMDARREKAYKPEKAKAAKRAKVIEVEAANAILEGSGEDQFRALMQRWIDQKPVVPEDEPIDQAFMAQIAYRIQQMQEAQRALQAQIDDDEALIALLM